MLPEERRHNILRMLRNNSRGSESVAEIADAFGVSRMTVRRDLNWLQSRALVRRVHGGAMVSPLLDDEKPFNERSVELTREKQEIGKAAARLVRQGERIILDAGTTTREVARNFAEIHDLTVITNALPIVQDLARFPRITTIILGGLLKHKELCAVGPMVTRELARLSVDKVFLSTAGFDIERGLTDPDLHEAEVKEAMIHAAGQVILVADSSKWHQVSLARIADLDAIDILVSDDNLSRDAIVALEAEGVRVVTLQRLAHQLQD